MYLSRSVNNNEFVRSYRLIHIPSLLISKFNRYIYFSRNGVACYSKSVKCHRYFRVTNAPLAFHSFLTETLFVFVVQFVHSFFNAVCLSLLRIAPVLWGVSLARWLAAFPGGKAKLNWWTFEFQFIFKMN